MITQLLSVVKVYAASSLKVSVCSLSTSLLLKRFYNGYEEASRRLA